MAKQAADEKHEDATAAPASEAKPHCGIIMPISDSAGYDPGHWLEVRRLIVRAAKQAGYNSAGMVSENDGQDVIHRSIVKNIYHNELVVCDVSSLNPNVMLELGLRMANKKPLIVVFDGEGVYPFDIKNMLYISYPKGLHHFKVETFVQELTTRMVQVTEAAKIGKYEPFLNHFNDVVIEESKLGTTTQSVAEIMATLVDEIKSIKGEISALGSSAKVANATESIPSAIFDGQELEYIKMVCSDMVNLNPGLNIGALVDITYGHLRNVANNKLTIFHSATLFAKLENYQKSAKYIIRGNLVNIFAARNL